MKIQTALLVFVILALAPACKQKKTEKAPVIAESSAPLLKSDVWQGTSDQIDPQLGKIKSLD